MPDGSPGRKRPLPMSAVMALEVFADHGRREMPKNDLELRAHQRGLNGRDVVAAIQAFHRRGWVEHDGSTLVISQTAFALANTGSSDRRPPRRARRSRMPRLFG
jgi:hypothetical protein